MDDIFTIKEVANRLKVGERTVTAMLADGELPGFQIRGQWRLRREDFEKWLERHCRGRPRAGCHRRYHGEGV